MPAQQVSLHEVAGHVSECGGADRDAPQRRDRDGDS
jgi:hypothetical protein